MRMSPQGGASPGSIFHPSTVNVPVVHMPLNGIMLAAPAPFTPGSCPMRAKVSSKNRPWEGGSG